MRCAECRFCHENEYGRPSGWREPTHYSTLHCRRYPPTRGHEHGNVTPSMTAAWVEVRADWWCGEFAAKL